MTFSDNSTSPPRHLLFITRRYLGSRAGLIAMAAVGLGAGAYFNWGWLVAAGLAPIILAAAPCAAMCAMGLCMGGKKRKPAEPDGGSAAASQPPEIADKAASKTGKGCC